MEHNAALIYRRHLLDKDQSMCHKILRSDDVRLIHHIYIFADNINPIYAQHIRYVDTGR